MIAQYILSTIHFCNNPQSDNNNVSSVTANCSEYIRQIDRRFSCQHVALTDYLTSHTEYLKTE